MDHYSGLCHNELETKFVEELDCKAMVGMSALNASSPALLVTTSQDVLGDKIAQARARIEAMKKVVESMQMLCEIIKHTGRKDGLILRGDGAAAGAAAGREGDGA